MNTDRTQPNLKFRAQVMALTSPMRWVDGGLFSTREDAEADAERLRRKFASRVRAIEEEAS